MFVNLWPSNGEGRFLQQGLTTPVCATLLASPGSAQALECSGNPRRVLQALRFGRRVASLFGSLEVEVELRNHEPPPAAARCPAPVAFPSADGYAGNASFGGVWVEPAAGANASSARASLSAAAGAGAEEEAASAGEGFELLAAPRRLTLEQFYFFLRPALQRLAADADAAEALAAAQAAGGAGPPTAGGVQADELSSGECSICFSAGLDTVAVCGHAFCSECYGTWRKQSARCPLCRGALPGEGRGMGAFCVVPPPRKAVAAAAAAAVAAAAAAGAGRAGAAAAHDDDASGDDGMPPGCKTPPRRASWTDEEGAAAEPPMTLAMLTRWLNSQPAASSL